MKVSVTSSNEGLEGWLAGTGVGPFADLTVGRTIMNKLRKYVVEAVIDPHNNGGKSVCIAWPYQPNIFH
jgi:hypothetical protein